MLVAMLTLQAAIKALAMIVAIAVVVTLLLTRGLPALFAKGSDDQRDSPEPAGDDVPSSESP